MFAVGKQRRSGASGQTSRDQARRKGRGVLRTLSRAVSLPLALPYGIATHVYKRLRPRSVTQPEVLSQAEVFVRRMQSLRAQGQTLAYLLQTCILRLDMLLNPQGRIAPADSPRTMPAASLRVRRIRRYHVGPLPSRRGVPLGLALTMVAPGLLLAAGFGAYEVYESYIDSIVPPETLAINHPSRGARIYDRNGELLYEFIDQRDGVRLPVKLEDVSPAFLAATIATEDDTFFTNPGLNPRGLARAAWENLSPLLQRDKEDALEGSGGSSITQQLVKNVYIPEEERGDRTVDRKLREATYALELTSRYDKRQILEWYVNQISYGGLYLGVEAASQGYFGKPAGELTLAEAALLAGIPQSPARYDPISRPESALGRRNEILDIVERRGSVQIGEDVFFTPSPEDVEAARQEPLEVRTRTYPIEAPHFVLNHVGPQLETMFGSDALYRDGLVVTTSIDMNLQRQATEILERWIREFETISNSRNGAVIVLDAHSGDLLTVIGSRDYFRDDIQGNVDNLTALNSPGSSFKPFVYLTSFEKLNWTPQTLIDDSPVTFRESDGSIFQPLNPSKGSYLGQIPIARALGNSLNVPAFKAALRLGVPAITDTAQKVGFTTLHGFYGPAIAIGGVDLTAMDLVYAYSVLANNGAMVGQTAVMPHDDGERGIDPVAILRIEDLRGKVLYDVNEHRKRAQVVSPLKAYQVTSILSDPSNQCITFGCGGVSVPGRVAAVKTGTSEPFDPRGPNAGKIGETWAFGYTPDFVVGVWAGNSDNAPIVNIFSTSISFRVMRDTLQLAHGGRSSAPFARPQGLPEERRAEAAPSPIAPDPNRPAQASVTGASASSGGVRVTGSAVSGAMQSYRLEVASGDGNWRAVSQGSSPVTGGVLGTWPTLGVPSGVYSLRVVIQDAVHGTIVSPSLLINLR